MICCNNLSINNRVRNVKYAGLERKMRKGGKKVKKKSNMLIKSGKKLLALVLVFVMTLSVSGLGIGSSVKAAENEYAGNLLVNPGFDDSTKSGNAATINSGWKIYGGGGQYNNPRDKGGFGFYLNGNLNYYIKQTVTVPYTGLYNASVYLTAGKGGAPFGIRYAGDTTPIAEVTMLNGGSYTSPVTLPTTRLNQGDEIEIYVYSINSSWVNGDDFSLTYDFSKVTENLLNGVDFGETSSVDVRVPWTAGYILTATVAATEATTVKLGTKTVTVNAGETKDVTLKTSDNCNVNDMLTVAVEGSAVITNASLKFDPDSIPNEAPVASNVSVTGNLYSGEILSGSYDFADADGHTEGSSVYRWLLSDAEDGTYTAIEGETGSSLLLTEEYDMKYVKFEVTPVDSYGKKGKAVVTDVIGLIHTNLVSNPSMEIATGNFFYPDGWTQDGATFINNGDLAYDGLRAAEFGKNAEVYTTITAPKNGNYTFMVMVNTSGNSGEAGLRMKGASGAIKAEKFTATEGYEMFVVSNVPLEKGVEVEAYVSGDANSSTIWADKFAVIYEGDDNVPEFTTLKSFHVEKQVLFNRDEDAKKIDITVAYGTDLSALKVTATVSDEATITPASGETVDFTNPVVFKITNGNTTTEWTVTVKEGPKTIVLKSDNKTLEDGFAWAVNKIPEYVITGKSGMKDDKYPQYASGPVDYLPGYWCSYAHESLFCVRDFSHQSVAGAITGLWEENLSMFTTIAKNTTEELDYWTPFGYNFDGTPGYLVLHDGYFLRELPADFEGLEKAYQSYLWTGDDAYINDPVILDWYENKLVKFVEAHDSNGNGVCESTGEGAQILGSYNERSSRPLLESGDAFGAQYQATLAYAGILKARGETEKAEEWYQKAADLKTYFNEEWGGTEGNYIHSYTKNLDTDGNNITYNDFSKETTWFIVYKELAEGNERTDAFLDFIAESVGDGMGDKSTSPVNIEAYTYLPDAFFNYNESETAWKYMQYILSVKDEPHEIAVQGVNGNYPEIPFTFVSHTITGMMGVEPNAPENAVSTVSRLPKDVGYVEASGIKMGTHELDVRHDGLTNSIMTNHSEDDLTWTVQFYGEYDYIQAGNQVYKAETSEINGDVISYAVVTVKAGETVNAKVVDEETAATVNAANEVMGKIDEIGDVTLESETTIKEARTAYDALSDEAKALVENVSVLKAAEAKLEALKKDHEETVAAAKKVEEQIADLGFITLESKAKVEAARKAYDALSEEAKAMVGNLYILELAEEKIADLEKASRPEDDKKPEEDKKPQEDKKEENKEEGKSPVTGDFTNIVGFVFAMSASFGGAAVGLKRKNREEE